MIEELQKIGLSPKEATVYETLVRLGSATANVLAKKTSSQRTVVYNVLQQLLEKGVINFVVKNKRREYMVAHPQALLNNINEKRKIAELLVKKIESIKPKCAEVCNAEVYEGIGGLKTIMQEIHGVKDLRVLNVTGLIFDYLPYVAPHLLKEEQKHNARFIATQFAKKTPITQFKKIKTKFLPKSAENQATTFIFDGKVILLVLKDRPFLVRIENTEIYEGYKKNFDLLWNKL